MTQQIDHAAYRVLVFGRDGTEILVTRSNSSVQLPEVTIPQMQRVAENVTRAMKRRWAELVVCLFEPDLSLATGSHRYIVTRHWRARRPSFSLLKWMPISDLSEDSFSVRSDFRVLQDSAAKLRKSVRGAGTSPFVSLTWFEELCGWVSEVIQARGLHWTGDFRQLNASPAFSLIRFETNGPAVWFKAAGAPNEREFPITLKLAQLFSKYTSELVAVRDDWNAWLALETHGTNLAETSDLSLWKCAAFTLAQLQIESMGNCAPLLNAGAHDLNAATLVGTIAPFVEVIAELMSQQSKIPPPVLINGELTRLGDRMRDAILELDQFEIPDTLGQLDLNPGNMIVGAPDQCVFLDWTEAYVGHPFYSFQYLLEHFRRAAREDPVAEQALASSYLAPWTAVASTQSLAEAMALAPLVAVFAYAAGTNAWRIHERLREPEVRGYFRALARRMNREANQLGERRRYA